MTTKRKRSLEEVVGKETYALWVDMLRSLVPDGRTHRLSVLVAGMLQYAYLIATDNQDEEPKKVQRRRPCWTLPMAAILKKWPSIYTRLSIGFSKTPK